MPKFVAVPGRWAGERAPRWPYHWSTQTLGLVETWALTDDVGYNHAVTRRWSTTPAVGTLGLSPIGNTFGTRALNLPKSTSFNYAVNNPSVFPNLTSSFTLAAWIVVNSNTTGVYRIFNAGAAGGSGWSIAKTSNVQARFTKNGVTDINVSFTWVLSQPMHFVMRVNSDVTSDFFSNGVFQVNSANTSAITSRTHHFVSIGSTNTTGGAISEPWDGQILFISLYSRTLSNAEIANLYHSTIRWDLFRSSARAFVMMPDLVRKPLLGRPA